ncbi:hypothetical protein [Micromonospora sp. 050-3]|uniref:hypothetical protein n=1 Tax=Micromonospora sp. 050-3 TaxID=2789265 RepID=UPI0039792942
MGIPVDELRLLPVAERNELRFQAIAPVHQEVAVIRIEIFGVSQAPSGVADRIPGRECNGGHVESMELAQHKAEILHRRSRR